MADSKISALTEKTTEALADDDLFVIVDSEVIPATTKKVKKSTFLSNFSLSVLKASAGTINAGQVVYVSGYDTGSNKPTVELANAGNSSKMPAIGIAATTITDSTAGSVIVFGAVSNQNTAAYVIGDALYVSEVDGGLTNVRPDGAAEVQRIGTVLSVSAGNGIIQVAGAFRTNALPNLAQDKIWKGDANGVPQQVDAPKQAYLQYSNSTAQTIAVAAFANVSLATDRESFANSLFTKVNATDFRADFTGQVKVSYCATFHAANNARALELGIQRNATDLTWTQKRQFTNDNIGEGANLTGEFILNCTTNDIFRLRMSMPTANSTITMPIDRVTFKIELFRKA